MGSVDMRGQQEVLASDLTVSALRDQCLERSKTKKSIVDDRHRFARIVELLGADMLVASLAAMDIERMKTRLSETKTRRGAVMKAASVNRHLALLESAPVYGDARLEFASRSRTAPVEVMDARRL